MLIYRLKYFRFDYNQLFLYPKSICNLNFILKCARDFLKLFCLQTDNRQTNGGQNRTPASSSGGNTLSTVTCLRVSHQEDDADVLGTGLLVERSQVILEVQEVVALLQRDLEHLNMPCPPHLH